jgi:hypothetical protein
MTLLRAYARTTLLRVQRSRGAEHDPRRCHSGAGRNPFSTGLKRQNGSWRTPGRPSCPRTPGRRSCACSAASAQRTSWASSFRRRPESILTWSARKGLSPYRLSCATRSPRRTAPRDDVFGVIARNAVTKQSRGARQICGALAETDRGFRGWGLSPVWLSCATRSPRRTAPRDDFFGVIARNAVTKQSRGARINLSPVTQSPRTPPAA